MKNESTQEKTPVDQLVERFKSIPTPVVSDVMNRHGVMAHYIRSIYRGAKLCGQAFTVKTYPSDNLMIHIGVKNAKPGDILVVDAGGYPDAGLWGELLTQAALIKGIGGLVIDGGIRDSREIEELSFPVFSKSVSARGGFKSNPGSIQKTVSCGNISVEPGDLIIGDDDGVVVIPLKRAEDILEKATAKLAAEESTRQKMASGIELFDILNLSESAAKLGY